MSETPLWMPTSTRREKAQMTEFQSFIEKKHALSFSDYNEFHKWSIKSSESFWTDLMQFYSIKTSGDVSPAATDLSFKKYGWFPNLKLNFAENLLKVGKEQDIALNFVHESGNNRQLTYGELRSQTQALQLSLKDTLREGDVLACYMPNIPETVISMLATTSLGGVFTSTSSDFGVNGVLDRFGQSRPKVLVAAVGYDYNGKYFDLTDKIIELESKLDSIEKIILVDFLGKGVDLSKFKKAELFSDLLSGEGDLEFKEVAFDSPLYIMYSSGTTGKPKCIVHSVGGTLLQHVKELGPHTNLTSKKNIFYFTTCGWMMWNWLVSSLYFGAKVTLYEGSPGYPSLKDFLKLLKIRKLIFLELPPNF